MLPAFLYIDLKLHIADGRTTFCNSYAQRSTRIFFQSASVCLRTLKELTERRSNWHNRM